MERVLNAGAHKVSLNTAAISQPSLIQIGAQNLGSQCIVVAIDAKYNPVLGSWEVYTRVVTEYWIRCSGLGSRGS